MYKLMINKDIYIYKYIYMIYVLKLWNPAMAASNLEIPAIFHPHHPHGIVSM